MPENLNTLRYAVLIPIIFFLIILIREVIFWTICFCSFLNSGFQHLDCLIWLFMMLQMFSSSSASVVLHPSAGPPPPSHHRFYLFPLNSVREVVSHLWLLKPDVHLFQQTCLTTEHTPTLRPVQVCVHRTHVDYKTVSGCVVVLMTMVFLSPCYVIYHWDVIFSHSVLL